MALFYRLDKNKNKNNAGHNKWHSRAVTTEMTASVLITKIIK